MPPRARAAGVRRGHSHQRGSIGGVLPVLGLADAGPALRRRAASAMGLKLARMDRETGLGGDSHQVAARRQPPA